MKACIVFNVGRVIGRMDASAAKIWFLLSLLLMLFQIVSCIVSPCPTSSLNMEPVPFHGACPKSGIEYNNGVCNEWDIVSMILLMKSKDPQSILSQIKQFLKNVSSGCSSKSTYQNYSPGTLTPTNSSFQCRSVFAKKSELDNAIDAINLNSTFLNKSDAVYVMKEMFRQFFSCYSHRDYNQGGILYFFTDFSCSDRCLDSSTDLRYLIYKQMELVNQLQLSGFIMKIIFIDHGETSCDIKTALDYCAKYEEVVITGSTVGNLQQYIDIFRTCQIKNENFTTKDIVIMVTVPLLCIIFIIIIFVNVFLYKRKGRQSVLERFRAKEIKRLNEIRSLPMDLASISERYERLKNIVNEQRNSNLEISKEDIYIESGTVFHGAFSNVYKGIVKDAGDDRRKYFGVRQLSDGHLEVAVKRLPHICSDKDRIALFKEMELMKTIPYHPNIVSIIGTVSCRTDPMIIMEFCEKRDLRHALREHRINETGSENISQITQLSICHQISVGMNYIHSLDIIHRDLAARNILVTTGFIVKIGDFGLACSSSSIEKVIPYHIAICWTAMEALESGEFSHQSDVWSFGVVLFEIYTYGQTPYAGIQPANLLERLKEGHRLKLPQTDQTSEISALMQMCFCVEVQHRPTFLDITQKLSRMLRATDDDLGYIQLKRKSTLGSGYA